MKERMDEGGEVLPAVTDEVVDKVAFLFGLNRRQPFGFAALAAERKKQGEQSQEGGDQPKENKTDTK